jgi:thioredoxin 1
MSPGAFICSYARALPSCDFLPSVIILCSGLNSLKDGWNLGRRNMAGLAVVEVNDASFEQEVLQSDQPVLVDFWAAWCGPCKALSPIVDEVASEYSGKLKVMKMDVDRNQATPMRYGIRGIPALLLFKGGKVADQIVGYVPKDTIARSITRVIG